MRTVIYLKLILTALFWGGTFVAGRLVADDISPATAAFLRFAMASCCLLGLTLRAERRLPSVRPADIIPIILLGVVGIAAYNICFFKGLRLIEASRASLIIATCPIFITVSSAVFFKERLTGLQVLGIVLSVLGAVTVIARGRFDDVLAGGVGPGELLILGCVLCWTVYSLIGKPLMARLSPLTLVTYSAVIGALGLLIAALGEDLGGQVLRASAANWLAIAYLAVCGTVIGFVWFYEAIKALGPTRAGLFINFVPVWAIVLAVPILGEPVTISLLIGTVLVVTGVYLTNRRK